MKRIVSLVLALLLFCCLLLPAAAEENDPFDRSFTRFNDFAGVVSEEEEAQLNAKVRAQIAPLQMDLPVCVFLTRQSTSELSDFAADFYERNRFGCGEDKSGILLVLDLQNAKFGIYYYGEAETLIGEAQQDALSDSFKADCRNEDLTYYQAFDRYYDTVFEMMADAREHPTTTAAATQTDGDSPMPDWYPANTEGFRDFHGENLPPVVDDAHIFTDEQFATLSDKISAINERFGISYVAFTSDDNHGLMPEEYSSDFLHFNGYGVDEEYGAVVFYLSLDPADRCWLTTSINSYESLFTADVTYEIDETVDSSIRGGEYYEAFLLHADYVETMFANMCEDLPAWYPAGTRTFRLQRDGRTYAAQANAAAPRITDSAGILTGEQLQTYSDTLRTLSQQYGLDLVIFTDTSGRAPKAEQYADDFYYYNGYGADGICMYLIGGDSVRCRMLYYGNGKQFEKASITQRLSGSLSPEKKIEKYIKLLTFVLGHNRLPMHPAAMLFCLAVGVVAGLIAASLIVDRMKQSMRITHTVSAVSYLVDGSLRLGNVSHQFLYADVTRTAIPKPTESSGSSSSGSRGGSTYTSGHSAGGSYSSGGRRF